MGDAFQKPRVDTSELETVTHDVTTYPPILDLDGCVTALGSELMIARSQLNRDGQPVVEGVLVLKGASNQVGFYVPIDLEGIDKIKERLDALKMQIIEAQAGLAPAN